MKILVTGCNGFIGSHFVKKAIELGHNICGIDIADVGFVSEMLYYKVNLVSDELESILDSYRPDVVVHCAGSADVNFSVRYPEIDYERNYIATQRLLYALDKVNCKCRFIFLSSAAVYGQPEHMPITEETEKKPLSPYAENKSKAEDECLRYADSGKLDIVILRIFSAYGPGLKKQLFWDMYKRLCDEGHLTLFGTGEEKRDYIYIDDIVNIIYLMSTQERLEYEIYNIASGRSVKIKEVGSLFSDIAGYGKEVSFNNIVMQGNPQKWEVEISRIRELYSPVVSLESGIKQYLYWVQNSDM